MAKPKTDRSIPYTVLDPDARIPYRVRVATPSPELRNFVVPRLGVRATTYAPTLQDERKVA